MLKHKCARASLRKALWEREYPPDQNRPSWGWRLSSSWGKSGGRWVNFDELPKPKDAEEQRVEPWYSELQSSQEIFRRKMAEIRKRVDEDPFKAIFGRKLDRACVDWSPLIWGLRKKAERETGAVEGSSTEPQPQSKPTEKADDDSKRARHTVGENPDQVNQHHARVLKSDTIRAKAVTHLEPTTETVATKTGNNSSLSSLSTTEEYMIDPITLRKVPRTIGNTTPSDGEATNIPVKKFAGYRAQPSDNVNAVEIDNRQDALEIELSKYKAPSVNAASVSTHEIQADPVAKGLQEYELCISNESESPEEPRSVENFPAQDSFKFQSHRTETKLPVRGFASSVETTPRSKSQPPQIESSLSRRLRNRSKVQPEENQRLCYDENESTVEDIDLLRASDVRAASGLAGRPRKERDEEKQRRRRKLEDDFNKPQGLETQFAEEITAQTVASLKGIRSQESPVPETNAFGYDLTPQGLETSYERELQNRVQTLESSYAAQVESEEAALRDAEVDGFDRRPQGLETSFAREKESQKPEGLRLGEMAEHVASLETADIEAVGNPLQRLETPSPLKHATPSSQTVEPQYGELHSIKGNDLDSTSQITQKLPAGKTHQPRGEGDMSANVQDFAIRDRWYKKQVPQATKENATIVPEELASAEVLHRIFDGHRASRSKLQQENNKIPTEDNSHDASVERGLEAYDSKLGKEAYHFHTGQDSLEADILEQSERQIPERVEDEKVAQYSSYSSPEALAMRWEEEEQKLHEEIRETNDILSEAKAELSKLIASNEKSEPVGVGEQTSEPMESQEQSARPSTVPDANALEMDEKAALLKDGKSVLYRILAHNISSNKVVSVTASSSIVSATETPISLPEAISRLANPAEFLPHFRELDAAGYEVVSGGHDVLVFRKVLGSSVPDHIVHPVTEPGLSDRRRPTNPIDGTTTQTGNFASPTGFVNHDAVYVPPSSEQAPASPRPVSGRTGGRVRREEDVFSGSSRRWQDEDTRPERPKGKVRKLGKRVLLVGAWTAGCCYAVGVVAEFFRTGGANGTGAQGF